jgi:hypothetical protein
VNRGSKPRPFLDGPRWAGYEEELPFMECLASVALAQVLVLD